MSQPTLTRTDQVQKVLREGGRIEATGEGSLVRLIDRTGKEVPAWQAAMKTAQKRAQASS
ncbi:MAG: hypothetical protein ACTHNM_17085 [Dyella sp.]|uniref:hypothetical protein n=1 Tax=Dyella sp. TaxID=1869338 RepID=UPI003F809309